jgi:hypothetical protein
VEALRAELCQAQLEVDRLRQRPVADAEWTERLAAIMAAAEQLWSQAGRDAAAVRAAARS